MTATPARPIVFCDTETTGLHADRRPWEIALIRRDPDGTETERLIQIADVDMSHAELKGLQIGRIHERHLNFGGTTAGAYLCEERQAALEVEAVTRDAIIVGAAPNFDTEVLAAMLRRHQLCPAWHYQLVDVETLAAGWLRGLRSADGFPPDLVDGVDPLTPPWHSDHLSLLCGVQPPTEEDRHTALGDARWVRRWYDRLHQPA